MTRHRAPCDRETYASCTDSWPKNSQVPPYCSILPMPADLWSTQLDGNDRQLCDNAISRHDVTQMTLHRLSLQSSSYTYVNMMIPYLSLLLILCANDCCFPYFRLHERGFTYRHCAQLPGRKPGTCSSALRIHDCI